MRIWSPLPKQATRASSQAIHTKQILIHFCSNLSIADSYEVDVPCTHPKTSKDSLEKAIGENYPVLFHEAFNLGNGKLADVWKRVRKTSDDKLSNRPMSLERDWGNLCIPLYVHGDGVEFSKNDNFMVFSWGPLGSNLSTLLKHWPLACFPKSSKTNKTWEVVWKWLRWSFTALAAEVHPSASNLGKRVQCFKNRLASLCIKKKVQKNFTVSGWRP